jgi:hypothetical protein
MKASRVIAIASALVVFVAAAGGYVGIGGLRTSRHKSHRTFGPATAPPPVDALSPQTSTTQAIITTTTSGRNRTVHGSLSGPTAGGTLAATSRAPVYSPPASIAANCSADVGPALNNWIATVPDGRPGVPTIVSFPSSACFDVEESLLLWQRNFLDFEGNGAHFESKTDGTCSPNVLQAQPDQYAVYYCYTTPASNNGRAFLFIDHSTNITANRFSYRGSNNCADDPYSTCYQAALESQAGFTVDSGSVINLTNNDISHVWGDCMQLDSAYPDFAWPDTVTFVSNVCDHIGRHGWSSNAGSNVTVQNNTFTTLAYDAVDLEVDSGTTSPNGCLSGCFGAGWNHVTDRHNLYSDPGEADFAVQDSPNATGEDITFANDTVHGILGLEAGTDSPNPYFGPINFENNVGDIAFQSSLRDSIEYTNVVSGNSHISGNTAVQNAYGFSDGHDTPCSPGTCVYEQAYAIGIWSSNNVTVSHNDVQQASAVAEVDTFNKNNNNGQPTQFGPSGARSRNIVISCNSWGTPSAPQSDC